MNAERQAMGYFAGKFGHGIEFQSMVVAPRGSAVQLRKGWNGDFQNVIPSQAPPDAVAPELPHRPRPVCAFAFCTV